MATKIMLLLLLLLLSLSEATTPYKVLDCNMATQSIQQALAPRLPAVPRAKRILV